MKLGKTVFLVFASGCVLDSVLAEREATTERLRAEMRQLELEVCKLEARRARLEAAAKEYRPSAIDLANALRDCGFTIADRAPGVLRLSLVAPPLNVQGKLDALASARLARMATLIREWLPDHEISIESPDMARAIAAVRVLNEQAGVPGSRLRAVSGPGGGSLLVEIRPAQAEALQEMLAASME